MLICLMSLYLLNLPLNIITEYKFEDHKGIPVVYYKQLEDRKNMMILPKLFIYYKLNKIEEFNNTYEFINNDIDEDRKLYAKMIYLLYKANKNNIKQLGKMLNEASENKMMLEYSNIHYIIVKEYEKIKYSN